MTAERRGIWQALTAPRMILPLVVLASTLLLGVVIASGVIAVEQRRHAEQVQHTFMVERHISRLLEALQNAETGQRGYLLTMNRAYLAPYENAAGQVGEELAQLRDLTSDNPSQTERLRGMNQLSTRKLAELAETIGLADAGNRAAAMALVQSDAGKETMDGLRAEIQNMRDEEQRLLNMRAAELQRSSNALAFLIPAAAIGIALIALIVGLALRRYSRSLLDSQAELSRKNTELGMEILARRDLEEQNLQLQKMEAVGQLTGGIAHDFNNMLAVVIGALNLLQRRVAKGDTNVDQFVDAALDGARRAATLTTRLLAFSRQQPLNPEVISPNRLVSGMSELLNRTLGEQIDVETVLAAGGWSVKADASQLENAILNLAVNAKDSMPEGGRLTIETANCHLDDGYSEANLNVKAGQYMLIAITDTGAGMPEDVVAKAFDPFFTTKPIGKGTGLGLSQVHGFVKQSGGHIKIYSEQGHGTTIKIYLPRSHESLSEAAAVLQKPATQGDPSVVILMVEDDDQVRLVTLSTLRDLGYTVLHASRPSEALEKLRSTPDVTLLFTDVVMPEMSGRQLADIALAERPELKVLFTTGYTQNAIVHNGVLDPDTEFLMKPFSIDQLAEKIARVLAP